MITNTNHKGNGIFYKFVPQILKHKFYKNEKTIPTSIFRCFLVLL